MAVSKRTRFEVFKRDRFTCQYCGRKPPAVTLEVDHVVAESAGGPDTHFNLITACFDCNRGKGAVFLSDLIQPLADQLEKAKEQRENMEAYNQFLIEQRRAEEEAIIDLGRYWHDKFARVRQRGKWVFGGEREASIRNFLRRMPSEKIREAMDLAEARVRATSKDDLRRWRYFCGICWNMIREAEAA